MQPNDDLIINDGEGFSTAWYPKTPSEQVEKEAVEKGKTAASYPVLEDFANWLMEQVEKCPDISNIETKSLSINGVKYGRTVSIEAQVLAYQLLQELLLKEYHKFQEWQADK